MKFLTSFLVTLSFLFGLSLNQNTNEVLLKTKQFNVIYSKKYKEPIITFYKLNWSEVKLKSKNKCRFHYSKLIDLKYQYNSKKYSRTGYDRGHSANKADFDDTPIDKCNTYVMINVVPQSHYFNAYIWGEAEKFERILTKEYNTTYVYNIFLQDGTINKGLVVPKYQIKLIYVPKINKMFGFLYSRAFQKIKENQLETFYLAHFDGNFRETFLNKYNIKIQIENKIPTLIYKGKIYKFN